jgi:hypothetical protein
MQKMTQKITVNGEKSHKKIHNRADEDLIYFALVGLAIRYYFDSC